mmetsp:Transcript_13689/g.17853  ORF Transcript_13689/g.17853 Transcript_13689/m.17853 type:complete len:188 (+) Transcript_13689:78-641(+)
MGNFNPCLLCDFCLNPEGEINASDSIRTEENYTALGGSIAPGVDTSAESPTPQSWFNRAQGQNRNIRRTLSNKALLEHKGSDSLSSVLSPLMTMPPSIEEEREFTKAAIEERRREGKAVPKECILCMDGFSREHPEVHTLCSCGVNKHSYHYSCLLAWRSRSGRTTCPICDKELFFEEPASGDGDEE